MKYITLREASFGLRNNKLWIVSHGGVSSEYFTKQLSIKYTRYRLRNAPDISYKGIIVHLYKPVEFGPQKALYIFGDLYNSIVSQINRHPFNASKLCNDTDYKKIYTVQQLKYMGTKDPFNICKQFINFMNDKITYELFIMKYNPSDTIIKILKKFIDQDFEYVYSKRSTNYKTDLSTREQQILISIYEYLNWIMTNMPTVIIRYPSNQTYNLKISDLPVSSVYSSKNTKRYFKRHHISIIDAYNNEQIISYKFTKNTFKDRTTRTLFKYNDNYLITYVDLITNTIRLYNIITLEDTPLWIDNTNTNDHSNLIPSSAQLIPYVYDNNIFFLINIKPLVYLCLVNIKTGQCNINSSNYSIHIKSPFKAVTNLYMWNYPNYVGFVTEQKRGEIKKIIFNLHKQSVECYESCLENYENELYDLDIKDTKIRLTSLQPDEKSVQTLIDFKQFCRTFSL